MARTEDEIAQLERKLNKRGFLRDARPTQCDAEGCGLWGVVHYKIGRGSRGGRFIEWCHACDKVRSFRNVFGTEDRVPDPAFDLDAFLAADH